MTADWQDQQPTSSELRARDEAITRCRAEGQHVSVPTSNGDAYAYPTARGDIAWGINGGRHGFCISQGRAPK